MDYDTWVEISKVVLSVGWAFCFAKFAQEQGWIK